MTPPGLFARTSLMSSLLRCSVRTRVLIPEPQNKQGGPSHLIHLKVVTPPGLFARTSLMSSLLLRSVRTRVLIPEPQNKQGGPSHLIHLKVVTPPGFEPRSQEPESCILSVELWGPLLWQTNLLKILFTESIYCLYRG